MSQCGKKENILNSNIFRKKHCFHEIFDKCEREFPCVISTVWKNEKHSLLTEIFFVKSSISIFFSKTIAFTNFFSKKVCERIHAISTLWFPHRVWKLREYSLMRFWQKFRESIFFTLQITKELIWWNFSVRPNFNIRTVENGNGFFCHDFVAKFRQINSHSTK